MVVNMETNKKIIKLMEGRGYKNKTIFGRGDVWIKHFPNGDEIISVEIIQLIWKNAEFEARNNLEK